MKSLLLATVTVLATTLGYSLQDPQEMPKPGPQHALLHKHVGTWDAVVIAADMEGKEQRSKASMTTTKGGEFHTIEDFKGTYMGMAFSGHGVSSYCPARKQYVTSWTDSMTPSPMILMGDYDEKTKKMTMTGECIGMSGKLEPCRTVTYFGDGNSYAFEMFGMGPDGAEMKMLRIEYTRKK